MEKEKKNELKDEDEVSDMLDAFMQIQVQQIHWVMRLGEAADTALGKKDAPSKASGHDAIICAFSESGRLFEIQLDNIDSDRDLGFTWVVSLCYQACDGISKETMFDAYTTNRKSYIDCKPLLTIGKTRKSLINRIYEIIVSFVEVTKERAGEKPISQINFLDDN